MGSHLGRGYQQLRCICSHLTRSYLADFMKPLDRAVLAALPPLTRYTGSVNKPAPNWHPAGVPSAGVVLLCFGLSLQL